MNKTKFKAWDKSRQHPCMIEVEAVMYDEFDKMSICGKPFDEDNGGFTHLEEGEFDLIQYTGLKDQNGVEIYKGDIVHVEPTGQAWSVEYDEQEACFIVYNQLNSNRRFDTDFTDPECPIVTICEGMEFKPQVIGNIYENKELIK
jgi:uncharacterized phage protein (TIGR01671 family)